MIEQRGYTVLRGSSLYDTEPWGGAEGGPFINAVYELRRQNTPLQLLQDLLAVELDMGRRRFRPLEARACDLDLLLWGSEIVALPELLVPHPRLYQRKFVLVPLCELVAEYTHPELKSSFSELLFACDDSASVRPHQP